MATTYEYKFVKDYFGNNVALKVTSSDGDSAFVPLNESNTDYQEYIAWTKASPKNVAVEAD